MKTDQKTIEIKDKYVDPENTVQLIEELKSQPTLGDVKALVDRVFPEWIVTVMNNYCEDYPHLQQNWNRICTEMKVRPAQVVIVEELVHDDAHSFITNVAECFTRAGFSVRRKREFVPCDGCSSAVPTQYMWQLFKEKNFTVPETWRPRCRKCI